MKKSTVIMSFVLASASASAWAESQDGRYIGVQYANATYSELGFPDAAPSALVARYGMRKENAAYEVRFGFGLASDTVDAGFPIDLSIDSLMGVYAIGHMPTSSTGSIYGVVGFTSGSLSASAFGTTISTSDSSVSFGMGAEFEMAAEMKASVEYMSYIDTPGYTLTAFNIGVSAPF